MDNVGRTASKNWLSLILIFLFTFSVSLVGARFVRSILVGKTSAETKETSEDTESESTPRIAPAAIELQSIVNSWIPTVDGRVGLIIYDLDRDELSASYNPDESFATSDLYQLILAYDGYRQIDTGIEKSDTELAPDLDYNTCLDLMVRESNAICAEAITTDNLRSERITNLITSLGMSQTKNFGQTTTPDDLALFLKHLWQHNDLSLASWAKFQGSLLEPSNTDGIDWRQGLPNGFSTGRVYSKASGTMDTAGNWQTYADLALVDFVKQDRHFAVIVLSESVSDITNFSRLGTLIEGKVIEAQ